LGGHQGGLRSERAAPQVAGIHLQHDGE